jgi:PAS domain S-box-containing protein
VIFTDQQTGTAELATTYGRGARLGSLRYPLEGSLAGWVTCHQHSLRAVRITPEAWPTTWRTAEQLGAPPVDISVLMTPLREHDSIIGCLEIVWQPQHDITDQEEALLEAVAGPAAIAITNARLYQEKERALQEAQYQAAALRISEERFRALAENTYDLLSELDEEGRFIYLSPNYPEVTGYSAEELLHRPAFDLIHPEDLPTVLAEYSNPEGRVIYRGRHKTGEWRWMESTGKDYFTATGEKRAVIVSRDISERKQVEDQLKEEAEVATILAQVGQALTASLDKPTMLEHLCRLTTNALPCDCSYTLLWDAEENGYVPVVQYGERPDKWETLRLVKMPRPFIQALLTRFEQDSAIQIIVPEWQHSPVGRLAQQHELATLMCIALRRDDEVIGIQVAALRTPTAIFSEQQHRIARGIAQTASLALANASLLEELTRANRLKEDFIGAMSHELRTPLNIILGYNQLLHDEGFGPLTAEQRNILSRIEKNANELSDLITTVLDLSRLQSNRVPLTLSILSLPEFLHELKTDLCQLQTSPGLRVEWQLAPELPLVQTDSAKLQMVLKNLLTNAIKFTTQGSVTISVRPQGKGVQFCIADTGIGIGKEDLPHIFEPFRQGQHPLIESRSGVGLGLYIVHQLLSLLEGSVAVESEQGTGSIFCVWLPQQLSARS